MFQAIKSNLGRRIVFLVAMSMLLVLVSLGISGWLAVRQSSEQVFHQRQALAQTTATYLDYVLHQNLERLDNIAFAPGVDIEDNDLEPEKRALHSIYLSSIFNDGVFITDKQTTVLWVEPSRQGFVGTNIAQYPPVQQVNTTIKPAKIDLSRYKKIAVLDFDGTQGKKIASYIESEISKVRINQKPYFNLISRSHLDKVLKEQALHMTGAINPKTASKVGGILGAGAVITGSVNAYDSEDRQYYASDRASCIDRTVFVSFTAQFINVQTGEIITSIREEKKNTATQKKGGRKESTGSLVADLLTAGIEAGLEIGFGPEEQMLDQAAQIVAANFVKKITPRIEITYVNLETQDEKTGMMGVSASLGIIAKIFGHFNGQMLWSEIFFEAGPGHDDEMAEGKEGRILLPGVDLPEGIQAEDKVQFGIRPELLAEMGDRFHGI